MFAERLDAPEITKFNVSSTYHLAVPLLEVVRYPDCQEVVYKVLLAWQPFLIILHQGVNDKDGLVLKLSLDGYLCSLLKTVRHQL